MRVERGMSDTFTARAPAASWRSFDVQLAFYALALAVLGLMMAYTNSVGAPLAAGSVFTRGLMWFAIALVVYVVAAAFDYRWLRTLAWLVYLVNIVLLIVTLAVGSGVGGVSRWVSIFGLQFQFSEVAKILMIGVLAAYVAARRDSMNRLSTLIGAGILMGPPFVLVMIQPDLGTSLVFVAVFFGILFMSGMRLRWLLLPVAAALAAFPILWTILQDYQKRRLLSFLDPSADPLGAGFQVIQSQLAVSAGGMFGRGLSGGGTGTELLPVQSTDFAAAVLFQELGFVGGVVTFALFGLLIWRILVVGWRSDDLFGLAFAAGVASMLLFQLIVNVGMVLGIMPVTGIPLPFVTHGGASLISIALGLGLLQAVAMRRTIPDWQD
ncbi:MAG TPA: FtsW/RodA/SpoVE family cell cycle protein [Candidatus Limnocylindrales bacterium]|nr:FtsW/RodA/SpoVE family cell cycle protein [Candidatus Limnocylindrales bacterium]